jgi:hypothetical protein
MAPPLPADSFKVSKRNREDGNDMSFKAVMRTLTISAFVSLGVVGAAGTAAVANAAAVHADTCTASTACPDDGGAGNG